MAANNTPLNEKNNMKSIAAGILQYCVSAGDCNRDAVLYKAEETFEKVLGKVFPEIREKLEESLRDNNKTGGLRDNVLSQLGWARYMCGDYEKSLKNYERALAINPKNTDALRGRAWLSYQQKDYDRAIEDFNRALEGLGSSADDYRQEIFRGCGWCYLYRFKLKESSKYFAKAFKYVQMSNSHVLQDLHKGLGLNNYLDGCHEEALDEFNKAFQYAHKSNKRALQSIFYLRSRAYYKLKQMDKARADFAKSQKGISSNPLAIDLSLRFWVYAPQIKYRVSALLRQVVSFLNFF